MNARAETPVEMAYHKTETKKSRDARKISDLVDTLDLNRQDNKFADELHSYSKVISFARIEMKEKASITRKHLNTCIILVNCGKRGLMFE